MRLIRGVHAVREALHATPRRIHRIVLPEGPLDPRRREILALARARHVPVYREPKRRFSRFGGSGPHQYVVAEVAGVEWRSLDEILAEAPFPALIVALDQVEDPRNLGAVVRAADGAGAHGILLTQRKTAPPSDAAVSASAGALLSARLGRVPNLADALASVKEAGLWVVGLSPEGGQPWYEFDFTVPVAVVLGSEHKGLRRRVAGMCDALVSLPQRGAVASLNLSVAAGVVLYEVVRQRSRGEGPGSGEP